MDHYKEIGFRVPKARRFMGLGERNAPLLLKDGTYALVTDHNDYSYDEGEGKAQGYGFHPILVV